MKTWTSAASSVFLLGLLCPQVLVAQTSKILPIQNTRGLNQAYLRPRPITFLDPQTRADDWSLAIANEFRFRSPVIEDVETWRLTYSHRWSTSQGQWQLNLPLIHRGGGVLDPFINWWHAAIADHQVDRRENTPFGSYRTQLHDGTRINAGTGIGDLSFAHTWRIAGSPTIGFKLPTGNPKLLLGSGGVDVTLGLQQSWLILPRIDFTLHTGLTYQSQSPLWSGTKPWITSTNLAVAYAPSQNISWIVQLTAEDAAVQSTDRFLSGQNRIITLAYSKATQNGTWSTWISEDGDIGKFNFNGYITAGADLSLGIKFTQKQ
jgi:hypothetical protein